MPRMPVPLDNAILIGRQIRAKRRELKLTQDILAAELGLSVGAISKKECGDTMTTAEEIAKIANLLDTPVAWFLKGVR